METRILFLCLALIFFGSQAFAQLSKKEKKEWKKRAKQYSKTPGDLKNIIDAKQAAENKVNSLSTEVNRLKSGISDKNARIAELDDQISRINRELASSKDQLAKLKKSPPVNSKAHPKGIVFKVQIGAFKKRDLSKYFENNLNFGGEEAESGEQKITIGIFFDYWEADTFKKYMREMGVADAWIVPYKDGNRIDIKDALEGVMDGQPSK